MIGYIRGKILEVTAESVLVDVCGVGYEIIAPLSTLSELQCSFEQQPNSLTTKEFEFWIYTHIREDILQLYGFLSKMEKNMFHSLLKVNGVGPKLAVNALSGATPSQIMEMIENEDIKALSKLPKVGKKTAEQMILTLKGKLVITPREQKDSKSFLPPMQKELISALVNLGFRLQDVEKTVSLLPKDIDLQDGIRQGLAGLTSI